MQTEKVFKIAHVGLRLFFFISIAIISHALLTEYQSVRWLYLLFPVLLTAAYLATNLNIKKYSAILSLVVLFAGCLIEPWELDAIEESFLMLPLCYIILFPGSLWPIAVGFLLVASYLIDLPPEEFSEFFEDAVEVVFITIFATVMTYFQQIAKVQSYRYKKASLTDHLTKVPNRKSFFARLKLVEKEEPKEGEEYAVIQIGLDSLKGVNDNLGYGYGDELLKNFAQHIKSVVAQDGEVYRLGGDELVILIPCRDTDLYPLTRIIEDLEGDYDSVCHIHSTSHSLRYCGGVALLKDAHHNVKVWGKNADAAVAKAKHHRDGKIYWYDDELMDATIRLHQVEVELEFALERAQFYLEYQPKLDVNSGALVGAEALIRWRHPDLGVVPPNDFIAIAEKTAQIIPIGRWVLQQAIQEAAIWYQRGNNVVVSVNVSSVQFCHDDIYPYIEQTLKQFALPAQYLQLEITETVLMEKHSKVAEVCAKLRQMGVSVAIDDFGVEYSSLNYLKQLPIDVLKIDKSFIDDCVENKTDHMIVRTIIQMGQNLGKTVIAEGVETEQQLAILHQEQCHHFQGYLFSKPLPASEFRVLLPHT
ncbi:diguanylate phosphodiesterase [Vibrio galatheae]|uniref:Diguanylate phosphodiesterase n=1 Tax=Vibrio galatheae TaxID=579748 RepID=A0A0F4NFE0_9VIBR|nr:GGDEF domain-containing phosphodiesterase [Vibrio galatheae]KJY81563.1 diguanylate phosphodiesterase [Vibrio galatheae]